MDCSNTNDETGDRLGYDVDAQDRVRAIRGAFDAFAHDNGAADLGSSRVLGRPLTDFIAGDEARHLYALLMARVRRRRAPARIPFRCDGPTLRRFMHLDVTPLGDGWLRFDSVVERTETRSRVRLLDGAVRRDARLLHMCSWCKRVRTGTRWLEVEDAVAALRLLDEPTLPKLSHGICPDCAHGLVGDD